MLRGYAVLSRARALVNKALAFYVVNSLIPPLVILYLSRQEGIVYELLMPAVAYEALCVTALILLLVGRGALSEYSVGSARQLLTLAGILGLVSALVIGGVLALHASKLLSALEVAKKVKKSRRGS